MQVYCRVTLPGLFFFLIKTFYKATIKSRNEIMRLVETWEQETENQITSIKKKNAYVIPWEFLTGNIE